MRIEVKDQITVNAPATEVWRVLAHEFENIDRWSSGTTESGAVEQGSIPEGAKVCGRVCDGIREDFTYYDEQAGRFGYKGIDLPWYFFINRIENNWSVNSLEPNKSVVEMRPEIDINPFLGLFLKLLMPLIKKNLGTRTLEELKYYVENDQPHPRKVKAQQKQRKVA
ncbi:hypothetical protein MNBD_CHLOROFLEXI01-915 [hydrothermal vent metagenome]|uniref:SRPBCC family protein n=1 Tax=hydrothermal vent metagenome TaxID=652676 RepID=A0A3B0W2V5_9ZZZZ